jgi:hypothetical protein
MTGLIDLNYKTIKQIKQIVFKKKEKAFKFISKKGKRFNLKICGRPDNRIPLKSEEDFVVIVKLISKITGKIFTRTEDNEEELIFTNK